MRLKITKVGNPLSNWATLVRKCVSNTRAGNCELCGKYDNSNLMVTCPDAGNSSFSSSQMRFLVNDSLICPICRYATSYFEPTKDDTMTSAKFNSLDIFGANEDFRQYCLKVISQLSIFAKTFDSSIQDLFIVEDKYVPREFRGTLNIIVDFKYLTLQRYRRKVSQDVRCNLLTLWGEKEAMLSEKLHRVLLFLSTMHCSSQHLNLWIWGAARIFHIDLFCALPARDIQIKPTKLYRV